MLKMDSRTTGTLNTGRLARSPITFPHLGDAGRPINLETGREAAESGALAYA